MADTVKVAIDNRSLPHSGIGTYTRNLLEKMPAISHAAGRSDAFCPVSDELAVEWVPGHAKYLSGLRRLYWENFSLPRLLAAENYDLLHNPRNLGVPYRAQCPVVVTIHDVIPMVFAQEYLPTLKQRLLYKAMLHQAVHRSDFILTDSVYSADEICRFFPQAAKKIEVVLLAGDPDFCMRDDKDASDAEIDALLGGNPYILTIGGSEPRKNNRRLVRAFRSLASSERRGHKLVIVGGPWRGLDLRTELGAVSSDVMFTGGVSKDLLIRLYNRATVFVFPSLYEGFGLPVLEAMGCGTPVICSHSSSLPEVAGEATIMIDPVDEAAMAAAMQRVLASASLRQELSTSGLAQCRKFSWDKAVGQTYEVYRKFAG